MFVVPDEILERFVCSQCKKYLTVGPTKVYPNRGIKCGRCSNADDAGVISLFGVLAEQALFRCVNRFEGCNQLLSSSDVAEHEQFCISKEYDCPCCIESFKGSGYDIYVHFKEQHAEQLLVNTPEFILEVENELVKCYLYRRNDLLFYINARYNRGEDELILNAMYLGTDQDASTILQMFTLHSLDGILKYKTKRKHCGSVIGGHSKGFKIELPSKDFAKAIVVCKCDLDTGNVENLVALPENIKKGKQDVEEKKSSIIKPSMFGNGIYPVTIFDPPNASGQNRGFNSGGLPVPSTSSAPSIFGNTTVGNSINQPVTTSASFKFGSLPISSNSSVPSIFSTTVSRSVPPTTYKPEQTSSSIFGKGPLADAINHPLTTSTSLQPSLGGSPTRPSRRSSIKTENISNNSRGWFSNRSDTNSAQSSGFNFNREFNSNSEGIFGSNTQDDTKRTSIFGKKSIFGFPKPTGN